MEVQVVDYRAPDAAQRFTELKQAWQQQRLRMDEIIHRELANFKKSFQEKDIPGLIIPGVNSF